MPSLHASSCTGWPPAAAAPRLGSRLPCLRAAQRRRPVPVDREAARVVGQAVRALQAQDVEGHAPILQHSPAQVDVNHVIALGKMPLHPTQPCSSCLTCKSESHRQAGE